MLRVSIKYGAGSGASESVQDGASFQTLFARALVVVFLLFQPILLTSCSSMRPFDYGARMRSWEKHNLEGEDFLRSNRPHEARTSFDLAVAQARHFGADDIRLGLTLANLASACVLDSDLNAAGANYLESISTLERARARALGPFEERLAEEELGRALTGYGSVCQAKNNLVEAEQVYARALRIYKNLKGTGAEVNFITYEVVRVLAGLADVCLGKSDYRRAEKIYKEALKLAEGLPGHFEIRRRLSLNLAKLFRRTGRRADSTTTLSRAELNAAQKRWLTSVQAARHAYMNGDFGEADALYTQALGDAEQMQDNEGFAATLRGQALVFIAQGRIREAKASCQRALELLKDGGNLEEDEIDRLIRTLTRILLIQESYQEVKPLLERRLDIERRAYGPESLQVAETMAMLAYVNQKLGRAEDISHYVLKAEKVSSQFPKRPRTSVTQLWLGLHYQNTGQMAKAENALKKALEIRRMRRAFGRTTEVLLALGKLYVSQGRSDDAAAAFNEAVSATGSAQGENADPVAFEVLVNYAKLLASQNKLEDAQKLYGEAAQMLPGLPDIGRAKKRECLDGYLKVLESSGKKAEAAEVRRQFQTVY